MDLLRAYKNLLREFGPQAWWPVKHDFEPKEFEICLGAILTQNTNWKNVECTLENLSRNKILTPEHILETKTGKLEEIIRPSGFYRQKAERLKTFSGFLLTFGSFQDFTKKVKRKDLLEVKGIGPETCDSILLYACGRPYFVIDAYTKRFVRDLGLKTKTDYETLREYFESRLPKDPELYKEFHALIVEWGKRNK